MTEKQLSARKKPSQVRSLKMVDKILTATTELIKSSDGGSKSKITTAQIAKKAGISVGSLYQYFPNTEAILYELYQQILAPTQNVLKEFNSLQCLTLPRDEFFTKLIEGLKSAESDSDIVFEMHSALKLYPALAEADKEHAEYIATEMAAFLKHYGSDWPQKKLYRLALYLYYMDYGAWLYRDHARPPQKEVDEWETTAWKMLLYQCFED